MWLIISGPSGRRRVPVVLTSRGTWVGFPGGSIFVPNLALARSDAPDGAKSDMILRAPMTGRVVQVNVAAGDAVVQGATLVVLEAMKMEYRVLAPRTTSVGQVHCRVTDGVDLGAVLVTLTE